MAGNSLNIFEKLISKKCIIPINKKKKTPFFEMGRVYK